MLLTGFLCFATRMHLPHAAHATAMYDADLSSLMVVTTSKPKPEPEWLKEYTGKRAAISDKRDHATVCDLIAPVYTGGQS